MVMQKALREPRTNSSIVAFSGIDEDTTVAINGFKNEQGGLGVTRVVHAQIRDDHYVSLRLHEPTQTVGVVKPAVLTYGLTPTWYYPNWVNTPPSQDFAALVRAIWPTIDLSPIMKEPTKAERKIRK